MCLATSHKCFEPNGKVLGLIAAYIGLFVARNHLTAAFDWACTFCTQSIVSHLSSDRSRTIHYLYFHFANALSVTALCISHPSEFCELVNIFSTRLTIHLRMYVAGPCFVLAGSLGLYKKIAEVIMISCIHSKQA